MKSGLGKVQRGANSSVITKISFLPLLHFSLNPKTPLEFASLLTIA